MSGDTASRDEPNAAVAEQEVAPAGVDAAEAGDRVVRPGRRAAVGAAVVAVQGRPGRAGCSSARRTAAAWPPRWAVTPRHAPPSSPMECSVRVAIGPDDQLWSMRFDCPGNRSWAGVVSG